MLVFPIKSDNCTFLFGKNHFIFLYLVHGFLIPFCVVLLIEGYDAVAVVLWFLALYSLLYINNFINIILSNKDNLFGIFLTNSSCFGYTITDFLMLPIILRHFSMPFSIRIGLCNTSCVHLLVCMLLLSISKEFISGCGPVNMMLLKQRT
jgi:hypothetical protein